MNCCIATKEKRIENRIIPETGSSLPPVKRSNRLSSTVTPIGSLNDGPLSPSEEQKKMSTSTVLNSARSKSISSPFFQHPVLSSSQQAVAPKGAVQRKSGLPPLSKPPTALVKSTFSHKGKFVCNFCFGRNCRVEDWTRARDPPIKGLHSNIISEVLVATARLSNRKIKEFDMLK